MASWTKNEQTHHLQVKHMNIVVKMVCLLGNKHILSASLDLYTPYSRCGILYTYYTPYTKAARFFQFWKLEFIAKHHFIAIFIFTHITFIYYTLFNWWCDADVIILMRCCFCFFRRCRLNFNIFVWRLYGYMIVYLYLYFLTPKVRKTCFFSYLFLCINSFVNQTDAVRYIIILVIIISIIYPSILK